MHNKNLNLIVEVSTPKITLLKAFKITNIVIKLQSFKNSPLSFRIQLHLIVNSCMDLVCLSTTPCVTLGTNSQSQSYYFFQPHFATFKHTLPHFASMHHTFCFLHLSHTLPMLVTSSIVNHTYKYLFASPIISHNFEMLVTIL